MKNGRLAILFLWAFVLFPAGADPYRLLGRLHAGGVPVPAMEQLLAEMVQSGACGHAVY